MDPDATTANYTQSSSALTFSPSISLGDTIGGSFDNAPYNWSSYTAATDFAVKISILSGSNPNLPFSLSLVDASSNVINFVGTTVGATTDTYIPLTLNGTDPGVVATLLGVTAAQFTWDGGATADVLVQAIAAKQKPSITSPTTATGTVGTPFSYQIDASNTPTLFDATTLPAGLSLDTSTGFISGTPTASGEFNVTISASNEGGTGTADLTLTIGAAPVVKPTITSATTANGTVGMAFNYQIAASNSPASFAATGLPAGLTINTNTGVISGTPTTAAISSVTISATNSGGTGEATLTLTVEAAPDFLPPGSFNLPPGSKVKLGITPIEGAKFQWLKARLPVKGATGAQYDLTPGQLSAFGPAQAGFYELRVTEVGKPAQLLGPWIITCADPTVIVYNLSARGTETQDLEPTESALVLGGYMLLQAQSQEVTLIMTRTIGKGASATRTYWVEERPDATVNSNGPVPGSAKMTASRTAVAGLGGTGVVELLDGDLFGLTGDREALWVSGLDALVRLSSIDLNASVVAPRRMTGFMGSLVAGQDATQIGNLSLTASINVPETFKGLGGSMDALTNAIVQELVKKGFVPAAP